MTFVVLFVLAVIWGVYLATWWVSRAEQRGVNSIATFSRHLSVLERTSPARAALPGPLARPSLATRGAARPAPLYPAVGRVSRPGMSRAEAQRRRANVLFALAAAAVVTLLFVPFLGTFALVLHLLTDLALVAYVALLVRARKLRDEQRAKVRFLPGTDVPAGRAQLDGYGYAAEGDDEYWLESAR